VTPLVEVLMSTYNGERYVREQAASILGQTHSRLRLVVRDDGSSDGSLRLLKEFHDPRVEVRAGANLGLPDTFFRLLDESSDEADLWALSDQDDVWLPEKLSRAVSRLSHVEGPALYCARVAVVDEALRPLYLHELPWRGPSFANALVQNIALGCTIVLNRKARDLLRGRWPQECVMHDAWMYLVVAGCGMVVYDHEPVVLYRQHSANAVGVGTGRLTRLRGRIRRQLSATGHGKHGRQNLELARLHRTCLASKANNELTSFLRARRRTSSRARYALLGVAHRQKAGSSWVMKLLFFVRRV
jgi:glycosyltransferase involved in cell wall biosynthesis